MEITKGRIPCAKKVVIYGPEGIGKSTFASQFPDPVFIDSIFHMHMYWELLLHRIEAI